MLLRPDQLFTAGNVVSATKQSIDFFQRNLLGFGNEEENKYRQKEINPRKHVERVKAAVV